MENVFVNFTNHPSGSWDTAQRETAQAYGRIVDVPFPEVDPDGDEAYIARLAEEYVQKILSCHPAAVLCQGEFCLAYQVISGLKNQGVPVLAACSERIVRMDGNRKTAVFEFRRFRRF